MSVVGIIFHAGDYSFKRFPFSFQDMAFYLLKDRLLHNKMMLIANLSEVDENYELKPTKYNKPKASAIVANNSTDRFWLIKSKQSSFVIPT